MAQAHGNPATDDTVLSQEQGVSEAEVERAANQAWTDSAHGGHGIPPRPGPLTYGPKKPQVRDKRAKAKARKRPSELLRAGPNSYQALSPDSVYEGGAAGAGAVNNTKRQPTSAAGKAARAYTQNVQQALHPIHRAQADYNAIENLSTTQGDPTAAVLAGAPANLDFDPYSEEDLAPRIEEAYPQSDEGSFTSVSVELKRQPHLNAKKIAEATVQAASDALQQEHGPAGSLTLEQRRQALQATIDDATQEIEDAAAMAEVDTELTAAPPVDSALLGDEGLAEAEVPQEIDTAAVAEAAAAEEASTPLNALGLPIDDHIGLVGQMTYPDIIEYGLTYVNKLRTIADLLNYGQVLMVRPHGFGGSFLLSQLECILAGYGQYVESLPDSEYLHNVLVRPVPVVRLDLSQFLIKIEYDEPALKAYQEYKDSIQSMSPEYVESEKERELQGSFAQNEIKLDESRSRLWRLRNGYQEIHNRLDELNRICALQQGVLMRSFAAKKDATWSMSDLALDPSATANAGASASANAASSATGAASRGGRTAGAGAVNGVRGASSAGRASASGGTGGASGNSGSSNSGAGASEAADDDFTVTAELSVPPLEEAFPLLNMDDEEIVIPRAGRPLVDALRLCEDSLRVLQWQQQSLGLQIDLYLSKEHWWRCQLQLDIARENYESKRAQLQEDIELMQARHEPADYILELFEQMDENDELRKARDRTAAAHARVVSLSAHLSAIRDLSTDSEFRALKQLQSYVNTLRQREAAAAAVAMAEEGLESPPEVTLSSEQVPESVRPLMEEIALMARLLREVQREWSKKRAMAGKLQKQQGELLAELKRLQQEQALEQAEQGPSEQDLLEMMGQKQFQWDQERDRLVNELATAYYQQFYLALAQPTMPNRSNVVEAVYQSKEMEALNKQEGGASAADAAADENEPVDRLANLTPEQESAIVANAEVTLTNFEELLAMMIKRHGKKIGSCALLLDSYDAALTSIDDCPDLVAPLQQLLTKMVNAIRINQSMFKHVFFLGSTDFSSNRVFFGFDRLVDISQLTNNVGMLLGFTEEEVVTFFAPEMQAAVERIAMQRRLAFHMPDYEYTLDNLLDEMQEHYGNYTFATRGATPLLRTKDVLRFLQDRSEQYLFKDYDAEEQALAQAQAQAQEQAQAQAQAQAPEQLPESAQA